MSKAHSPNSAAGGQPPTKKKASTPPTPVLSKTDPQRNDQEEIWECICSLGRKIRKDFKKSGTMQSSVKELEKNIQSLIDDIIKEEKRQEDTRGFVTEEKNKSKKTKQKTSVKEEEIDLITLFKTMKHEKIKLNSVLVTDRKDLKIICEKIYLTGKDLGIDVDDEKQHDVNSSKETITCLLAENRKLSKILIKVNKEIEIVDMQQKYACKDKKKLKTSKQSDKHHSDLSDETPFSVFKAFDDHAPRIIEILKNESMLQEQKSFAQCPVQDAHWSSEKEKKLLSLQEQIKSHEDSLITLLNAKRDMAKENSELKRKLEASERNFLKKSKEADNLICEKQTFEENCRKRLDQETRHKLAQMQKEMQERDFTSYK